MSEKGRQAHAGIRAGIDDEPSDVEVTVEMVKAGADAVWGYNPDFEHAEDVAVRVYSAMERARKRLAGRDHRSN